MINLKAQFDYNAQFVSTYDELPLWSAQFGLFLLDKIQYKDNLRILDIGCGTGFPTFELAQRFGSNCQVYALDTWEPALDRVKVKAINYEVDNVKPILTSANNIPFDDGEIDLAVSNLGINNFENPELAFKEIFRTLKSGGKLILTTNTQGHWQTFYKIFKTTINELGHPTLLPALDHHIKSRSTLNSIKHYYKNSGFKIGRIFKRTIKMKYYNGTSFLNHYFVRVGFLESWLKIIPNEFQRDIFTKLEDKLNNYFKKKKNLTLKVPMLYIEGYKN